MGSASGNEPPAVSLGRMEEGKGTEGLLASPLRAEAAEGSQQKPSSSQQHRVAVRVCVLTENLLKAEFVSLRRACVKFRASKPQLTCGENIAPDKWPFIGLGYQRRQGPPPVALAVPGGGPRPSRRSCWCLLKLGPMRVSAPTPAPCSPTPGSAASRPGGPSPVEPGPGCVGRGRAFTRPSPPPPKKSPPPSGSSPPSPFPRRRLPFCRDLWLFGLFLNFHARRKKSTPTW